MPDVETNENQDGSSNDSGAGRDKEEGKDSTAGNFECNICLDTAKDAVVSVCGHLFCWPCIHQWMEARPLVKTCPVCKAGISKEKVIPLYGRGSNSSQDPRNKAPPRPQGQRTEPEAQNTFMNGFGLGGGEGGFQFHLGVGAFPFGFFALFNNGRPGHGQMPNEMERGVPQWVRYVMIGVVFLYYWNALFG